jgi:hypothetical protein
MLSVIIKDLKDFPKNVIIYLLNSLTEVFPYFKLTSFFKIHRDGIECFGKL